MKLDRSRTPKWRPGYRFQYEQAQDRHVLLYPEGMIQFNGSAGLIGELVDGQNTVEAIITRLQERFPDVPELAADVEDFVLVAQDKHWLDLD